jgi:hypothetical protein
MHWAPALLRSPPSSSEFVDAQSFHSDYKVVLSPENIGCHSCIQAFAEPIRIVVILGSHNRDEPIGKFIIVDVDAWCCVWFHGLLAHCGSNQVAYRLFNYSYVKPDLAGVLDIKQRFLSGETIMACSIENAQRALEEYNYSDCRSSAKKEG